jgi:hypothetical protein
VEPSEFLAGAALDNSIRSGVPAKSQDHETGLGEEDGEDSSLVEANLGSPKRSRGRRFAIAMSIVLLLLLGISVPCYRLVRDYYNPWITEANWKRIQPGMGLEEVEAIVSKGKPCALEDVKAIVDPITNKQKEMERMAQGMMVQPTVNLPPFAKPFFPPPIPQNTHDDWDKSEDVAWQAKRQKVASWYQWKRGDTRLFVGINTENKVRLACLAKDSSDEQKAGISWRYSVYPFADVELIERTGKSLEAKLPEEQLVEQYIRSKAADPDSVEIALWGPHDLQGELDTVPGYQLVGKRRLKSVAKLRVRFWMKGPEGAHQLNDRLYYIQDAEVFGSFANPSGNKWIEVLRGVERQLRHGR